MMSVDEDGWKSVEILFDLIVNMIIIISINLYFTNFCPRYNINIYNIFKMHLGFTRIGQYEVIMV